MSLHSIVSEQLLHLRKHHLPAYLILHVSPPSTPLRLCHLAIAAFRLDLSRIARTYHHSSLSLSTRYQFYKDRIRRMMMQEEGKEEKRSGHPILDLLTLAYHQSGRRWTEHRFLRILNAYQTCTTPIDEMLPKERIETVQDWQECATDVAGEETFLLWESSSLLGVKDPEIDEVLRHLGKAVGMTEIVSRISLDSRSRCLNVPTTLLHQHRIPEEQWLSYGGIQGGGGQEPPPTMEMKRVIEELMMHTRLELDQARRAWKRVGRKRRNQVPMSLLLPAVWITRYGWQVERSGWNVWQPRLEGERWLAQPLDPFLPFHFWRHRLFHTF